MGESSQLDELLPKTVYIASYADVLKVTRTARDIALNIGFSNSQQESIVLVTSELASNVFKHAQRGLISLKPLSENGHLGLLMMSQDNGPSINASHALIDGWSTANSLGVGLGTINRLVDELELVNSAQAPYRNAVICKLWKSASRQANDNGPIDVGIICRPKPGQDVNGDAYSVIKLPEATLIALIDGLGHGFLAQKAALAAKRYIENHSGQTLLNIFQGVNRECLGTNGVVMALARFDWACHKLTFASVGNIEAKLFGRIEKNTLSVSRGIVGRNPPIPKLIELPWHKGMGMILHTDGLSSRWRWHEFEYLQAKPAQMIAEHIFRKLQSYHDDVTLMIIK